MIPKARSRKFIPPTFADLLLLVAAVVLLLAFLLLPWLQLAGTGYSGRELLLDPPQELQLYLQALWVVRVAAVAALLVGIWGVLDRRARSITAMTAFFAGLLALVYFVISLVQSVQGIIDLGETAAFGFWMGLAAAVGLVLQAFIKRRGMERQRRSLLLIPVLILLLAAALFLVGLTRNLRYVSSGEAGTVLYATSFDAFSEDWDLFSGRQEGRIADGVLTMESEFSTNPFYSAIRQSFTDFDVEIQIRATGGEMNNAYGLIFRLQPNNLRDNADDSYYLFLISSDGYYRVTRVIAGQRKILSNWIRTPVVNAGMNVDNTLRVVAQGNSFAFFINGQQMSLCIPDDPLAESTYTGGVCLEGQMRDILVDDSVDAGQLGVVLFPQDERFTSITADNMVVLAPRIPLVSPDLAEEH